MMPNQQRIFAEGISEKVFLRCLLEHLGLRQFNVSIIGGGVSKLPSIANAIFRAHNSGEQVFIILDSDSDFNERSAELQNAVNTLELPISNSFLVPNNGDPGDLETLLLDIAVEQHTGIYDCLFQYEACLRENNPDYCNLPMKGKVYAYCEALGIEPKSGLRDYSERESWNLDSPALEPLKDFLFDIAR